METEIQDGSEVQETTEVAAETTETSEMTAEQIADLQKKAEASSQNFERAKKAEAELKEARAKLEVKAPSNQDGLSTKDVVYLAKADIHADDVDDVLTYAKKMGVSVSEAHKFFKPILSERAEERKTASASHTKGGARGNSKVSGEELLRKAETTGEVPETAEGMQSVFEARQAKKFN